MSQVIAKNERSMLALKKLISSGQYEGEINDKSFTLTRTSFPLKYKIKGKLNSEGKFVVTSILREPMLDLFLMLAMVGFVIISLLSLLIVDWFVSLILLLIPILVFFVEYSTRQKEMEIFTKRFHSFHST